MAFWFLGLLQPLRFMYEPFCSFAIALTPGVGLETSLMPCALAGRTHTRLHEPDSGHLPSTNLYCMSCFGLGVFMIVGIPAYMTMTAAQRREIRCVPRYSKIPGFCSLRYHRYRYHIKGSNCDDCWRSTFCFWCAIVQEEKEVLWQTERKKKAQGTNGMTRREDMMVYSNQPPAYE